MTVTQLVRPDTFRATYCPRGEDFHYIVHDSQQLALAVTFSRYKSAGWTSWKGLHVLRPRGCANDFHH